MKRSDFLLNSLPVRSISVFALLLLLGISACNETKEFSPSDLGYDYYPIEIGDFRIYQVEEIKYRISGFDTTVYEIKETIFDSIQSRDRVNYLIRRDRRESSLDEWRSDSVWVVTQTPTYLAIAENSINFIKLTFPVKADVQWDGNGLNSRNEMIYRYQPISVSLIDSIDAADHMRVLIEDVAPNVTGVDLRSEVYARGVGLVTKDYLIQENCTASSCGDDLGKVVAGRSLKQVLIEVGHE